jgi:hypothetical protein
MMSAVGNKAKGMGYEYANDTTVINFMGIENIHAMRDSMTKLFELLNKDQMYVTLL